MIASIWLWMSAQAAEDETYTTYDIEWCSGVVAKDSLQGALIILQGLVDIMDNSDPTDRATRKIMKTNRSNYERQMLGLEMRIFAETAEMVGLETQAHLTWPEYEFSAVSVGYCQHVLMVMRLES